MGKLWQRWFFAVSIFPVFVTTLSAETGINVSADPVSAYTLLSLRRISGDVVEIATKRDAPMTGTSYSKLQVDCRHKTSRLIAEGATLEQMQGDTEHEAMDSVGEGTVTHDLAQYACENASR